MSRRGDQARVRWLRLDPLEGRQLLAAAPPLGPSSPAPVAATIAPAAPTVDWAVTSTTAPTPGPAAAMVASPTPFPLQAAAFGPQDPGFGGPGWSGRLAMRDVALIVTDGPAGQAAPVVIAIGAPLGPVGLDEWAVADAVTPLPATRVAPFFLDRSGAIAAFFQALARDEAGGGGSVTLAAAPVGSPGAAAGMTARDQGPPAWANPGGAVPMARGDEGPSPSATNDGEWQLAHDGGPQPTAGGEVVTIQQLNGTAAPGLGAAALAFLKHEQPGGTGGEEPLVGPMVVQNLFMNQAAAAFATTVPLLTGPGVGARAAATPGRTGDLPVPVVAPSGAERLSAFAAPVELVRSAPTTAVGYGWDPPPLRSDLGAGAPIEAEGNSVGPVAPAQAEPAGAGAESGAEVPSPAPLVAGLIADALPLDRDLVVAAIDRFLEPLGDLGDGAADADDPSTLTAEALLVAGALGGLELARRRLRRGREGWAAGVGGGSASLSSPELPGAWSAGRT